MNNSEYLSYSRVEVAADETIYNLHFTLYHTYRHLLGIVQENLDYSRVSYDKYRK